MVSEVIVRFSVKAEPINADFITSDLLHDCSILPILGLSKIHPDKLGAYLAGLIEGDGDIFVPRTPRTPSGRLDYGRISISFSILDLPLALAIQAIVGGYMQFRNGTSCHLHIKGKNMLMLLNLINGYFRTPKVEALHRLII